jgi:hypothetical protein
MAIAATDTELRLRLTGKKALTAVASPIDYVTLLEVEGRRVVTPVSFLRILHLNHLHLPNSLDRTAEMIAEKLNHALALRESD